jgi:protein-S-isoprenylcysteine O-methyltransferase Ste14
MGTSLSPWPIPTGEDLITTGLFGKIRHPLYAGLIALMGGLSIATGSAERLILTVALFYTLDIKSDFEERELAKQYSTYDDYKKVVTGKFFPSELLDLLPWKNSSYDDDDEGDDDDDYETKMIAGQVKWEL